MTRFLLFTIVIVCVFATSYGLPKNLRDAPADVSPANASPADVPPAIVPAVVPADVADFVEEKPESKEAVEIEDKLHKMCNGLPELDRYICNYAFQRLIRIADKFHQGKE